MEHNFPCPIKGDKDLRYYEEYLKKCDSTEKSGLTVENSTERSNMRLSDTVHLHTYLNTMVGKLVRVESLIGGCLESRVGVLFIVGQDYIVLKLYRGCSTMICDSSSIKYITVIHDNDLNKAGLY